MKTVLMLPKLENKTQTGTIVYIVLSIINCSTCVYNIYTVYNRIKHMPAEYFAPTELVHSRRLACYRTRIGRVQYSVNAFMSAFYFQKSR